MEHGVRVYDGVSRAAWETFQKKLQENQAATAKDLEFVHAARDFDINLETDDPNYKKRFQGDFKKPIIGIRTFSKLSDDLIVCTPHLDITRALQQSTGGKLAQRHNTYPERAATSVNPSRFDRPFFFLWVPSKGTGSVIVLTPGGFSEATQHVLETELLPRTESNPSLTDKSIPSDPFRVVQTLSEMRRLGKIDSATLSIFDDDGNTLETTSRVFREGGSLSDFKSWVKDRSKGAAKVALRSVVLSIQLDDPRGKTFDLVVRPGEEDSPIGIQVSQKSELRTDAYQVVMNALKAVLF
jgi:hypothetical protein